MRDMAAVSTRFSKSNKSGKNHRVFSRRHNEHRENVDLLQRILRVLRGPVCIFV